MTWEDAFEFAAQTIGSLCTQAGVGVEITDPEQLKLVRRLLRLSELHHDPSRVEAGAGPTGRD